MKKSDPFGKAISPHLLTLTFVTMLAMLVVVAMPIVCLSYNGYGDDRYGGNPYREPPVRGAIQITLANDNIVASQAESAPQQIELLPGETVRDVQVRGRVGAVATSERMLAISTERFNWSSLELNPGETTSDSYLSENIVLFVTMERGIVFDSELNRFVVFDVPVGERIAAQAVYADVAVFVTLDRTIGYRIDTGNLVELPFSPGEFFNTLGITAGLISVKTSERVLLFQGPSAQWIEWTEYWD